ncbi:type I methionyl aminopeptidase [Emcibacter sp. SYSU 3D8]|uniref:type I methionyl aminopeptidase n=1 Tax=Emcibacter sp. SYSU 3D8 TaxID=3133969 RepID=UPI0031FEAF4C
MTIGNENDLEKLREIGGIVARVLHAMGEALRPGISTGEIDALGRRMLDEAGAVSAPELVYGFPGATCISVNEEIAHGIPGDRVIRGGDLVNIDVSAEKDGYFADTGASFPVGNVQPRVHRLCRDGKRALWTGIRQVKTGNSLGAIGTAIGEFARRNRYTLVRNLASHGVGRSLHEDPEHIPTWPDLSERRRIRDGLVFTIEPFLSLGAQWAADSAGDEWTLLSQPTAPTVQYEHTMVATPRGAVVVTQLT